MAANNVHDEHRKRVKEKFLKSGYSEDTPEHLILETLLFYSIPRVDTNETAHHLLERFGSIAGVLDATREQLLEVEGIGPNSVAFFELIVTVMRKYNAEKAKKNKRIATLEEVCDYLLAQYIGRKKEVFSIATFRNDGKMIAWDILNEGETGKVSVPTRKLVETVLHHGAAAVLLAHNHPGGLAIPSEADIAVTEQIAYLLREIGVGLVDHIIIAEDDYVSLRQSKKFAYLFNQSN